MASEQAPRDADVVYVPAHPEVSAGRKDIGFETRKLASGGQAALAFTSLELLVAALGKSQPWLAMPLGRLREVMIGNGVQQVALDPVVPAEAWRWTPEELQDP